MKVWWRRVQDAFTLMEALIGAVILAMAITAITMPFTAAAHSELSGGRRTLAATLAQEMIEEILSRPFEDPDGGPSDLGPEPGENGRENFDNIDDYHGYVEQPDYIVDAEGDYVRDREALNLSRRVTVEYVHVAGQDLDAEPTFVRVNVEIRYKGVQIVHLTRLVYSGV